MKKKLLRLDHFKLLCQFLAGIMLQGPPYVLGHTNKLFSVLISSRKVTKKKHGAWKKSGIFPVGILHISVKKMNKNKIKFHKIEVAQKILTKKCIKGGSNVNKTEKDFQSPGVCQSVQGPGLYGNLSF